MVERAFEVERRKAVGRRAAWTLPRYATPQTARCTRHRMWNPPRISRWHEWRGFFRVMPAPDRRGDLAAQEGAQPLHTSGPLREEIIGGSCAYVVVPRRHRSAPARRLEGHMGYGAPRSWKLVENHARSRRRRTAQVPHEEHRMERWSDLPSPGKIQARVPLRHSRNALSSSQRGILMARQFFTRELGRDHTRFSKSISPQVASRTSFVRRPSRSEKAESVSRHLLLGSSRRISSGTASDSMARVVGPVPLQCREQRTSRLPLTPRIWVRADDDRGQRRGRHPSDTAPQPYGRGTGRPQRQQHAHDLADADLLDGQSGSRLAVNSEGCRRCHALFGCAEPGSSR